jgi:hypothetical protein
MLIPGLILGTIVRAVSLPLPGTGDVNIWKVWSFAAAQDLTAVYGIGGIPPERRVLHWQGLEMTVDYPPVALAELAVAGRIYARVHPLFEDSRLLNVAVKLPGLCAEIAFVVAALTWGRRRFGDEAAAAVALGFWLNPALILDGSVLGYLDLPMAVPAAAALAAAVTGYAGTAGVLLSLAVLTKAHALFVAPAVVAALIWSNKGRTIVPLVRASATGVATGVVVLVPFVLRGAWSNVVQALGRLATHDMLSANAANLWWLVTWWLRVTDVWDEWGPKGALTQQIRILAISRAVALGWPNPRLVGLGLVAAACVWAVWTMRKGPTAALAAALTGWCAYAYALLAAQVHENHLALAIPFFCVAAGLDRTFRPALAWLSGILTINLLLFYGFGRTTWAPDRGWTGIDASVLLALVNVSVFVWLTKRLARAASSTLTPRARRA